MASEFVRWVCVGPEGDTHDVTPDDFERCPLLTTTDDRSTLLRQFVGNELGRARPSDARAPAHIRLMQRHELVDYCDASEKGHLKWYPKGLLIYQLLMDYARDLAHEWGALEMKNPILIKAGGNAVGELMGEFHERDYRVDGGRGIGYLRYASDPLAFPFMQKVRFTLRQAPLKVYEEASCFRNEQEGEVSGLKRVRAFAMTDMHAACASVEQARDEFEALTLRFGELMRATIAGDRWVLGWEGTVEFFEANRDFLIALGRKLGVPSFFKLMEHMSHYYVIKNEFQSITADGANVQVSTVQWDVKDGPRFDIGYLDEAGRKVPCPVIIHASSFGSIERSLCALLENAAVDEREGLPPTLPYWLAPTQLRLIPVATRYVSWCQSLAAELRASPARCDVDDREETVGRKIRAAEHEWIPYVVVLGEREAAGSPLTVRMREERETRVMDQATMGAHLRAAQSGLPFRHLPTRVLVSQNPLFHG